jgi:hypothetical protein
MTSHTNVFNTAPHVISQDAIIHHKNFIFVGIDLTELDSFTLLDDVVMALKI